MLLHEDIPPTGEIDMMMGQLVLPLPLYFLQSLFLFQARFPTFFR